MNFIKPNSIKNIHKLSIAPMMDCTDRHFRMIMRKISSKALLYTEMIVAQSLVYTNKKENFLDFNGEEHPISIQFGGDEPKILQEAAQMAQDWGYDEINFNVGCPSPRVCSGNFGASLMKEPEKVAKCIESLKNNCTLPVTIKHRIGVDNDDSFVNLNNFVRIIANAGADRFTVHARKAILRGLNPKQNRTIPPLNYDVVKRLKKSNQVIMQSSEWKRSAICCATCSTFPITELSAAFDTLLGSMVPSNAPQYELNEFLASCFAASVFSASDKFGSSLTNIINVLGM